MINACPVCNKKREDWASGSCLGLNEYKHLVGEISYRIEKEIEPTVLCDCCQSYYAPQSGKIYRYGRNILLPIKEARKKHEK